jgi:hypothetical protein
VKNLNDEDWVGPSYTSSVVSNRHNHALEAAKALVIIARETLRDGGLPPEQRVELKKIITKAESDVDHYQTLVEMEKIR